MNDQVRKRHEKKSNVAGDGEGHSMIWGMFLAVTMNSATFMEKKFQDNKNSIVNIADLTPTKSYRDFDGISGEQIEFEWNIFPGFTTLQLCGNVKDLLFRLGETSLFMSMFNDISCGTKDNKKNICHTLKSYLCMQGSLIQDNGHLLVPDLRKGQLRSQGHWKLSIHYAVDWETIETIFRIILSALQLGFYEAVAEMCEEYETLHDRSGRPDMVMGQSINCFQWNEDRSSFGEWRSSISKFSIATIWRTNWEAFTTR